MSYDSQLCYSITGTENMNSCVGRLFKDYRKDYIYIGSKNKYKRDNHHIPIALVHIFNLLCL